MATQDETIPVLEVLGRAFPNQALSKPTVEVYLRMLEDIPIDLLWRAAERHMAESQYFPRIAELRGIAARLAGTDRFASLPASSPRRPTGWRSAPWSWRTISTSSGSSTRKPGSIWPQRLSALIDPIAPQYTRKKLAALQAVLEREAQAQPIGLHGPAE